MAKPSLRTTLVLKDDATGEQLTYHLDPGGPAVNIPGGRYQIVSMEETPLPTIQGVKAWGNRAALGDRVL